MNQRPKYSLPRQLLHLLLMWSLLAAFVASSDGCKKNTGPSPTPSPTTPLQQTLIYNTGLAQSNQSIEQIVEGLTAQKLITPDTARGILTMQFRIAAADKKLTAILVQGQAYATGQASAINDLITDINGAVNELITNGLAGVKDPTKRQAIAAAVSNISGLAKLIIVGLQSAGVLKAQAQFTPEVAYA